MINWKDMTVIMDNEPSKVLTLIRGKTYERPRGQLSMRADASDCNIKGKWSKDAAEYGDLWSVTVKGNIKASPSIIDVVLGLGEHYI